MNTLRKLTDKGIRVAAVDGKVKLSGLSSLPPDERDQVIALAAQEKDEILREIATISSWGTHTHLVQWFLSVRATLPTTRFTLWEGQHGSVVWATPAASYESLAREIEKGPAGQYAEEVRSILEQLHNKFGKGDPS